MTYERFEDIPVWQAALVLAERVFGLTNDRAFAGQGDLANQLQRAALSVSNNVAEGFERGSTNELIAFVYYARGSAGEVRSMLCLLDRMQRFGHLRSEISDLKLAAESCSRQLRGWADDLQNTPIRGQRHLNDDTRAQFDQSRKAEAFRLKLQRVREKGQPAPPSPDTEGGPIRE
jgi:four helix bundle protein